jgi:hypothetical protein
MKQKIRIIRELKIDTEGKPFEHWLLQFRDCFFWHTLFAYETKSDAEEAQEQFLWLLVKE